MDGVRATGGEIRYFTVEQMLRIDDAPPPKFTELLDRIESLKPRDAEDVLAIEKHSVAEEWILAALGCICASTLLCACIRGCHANG